MSRRTKRSTTSRARIRRPERMDRSRSVFGAALTAIVSSIRHDGAGLATVVDPLEAELFASSILAMWHADQPGDAEPIEILGAAVIRRLASRPNPDVLATLLALTAIAQPPFESMTREAVGRLRTKGIPEPLWSRSIGHPTLVDAWISTDELDDQSHVLAAFAYDHLSPHAFNLIIDANFQGLIRGAFVANDPEKVHREWTQVSGLPTRPLDEQALADLLGRGIAMYDLYLDPPVSDEAVQLMPLLRARLRLLPAPRPIEPSEVQDEERVALVGEFAASPEARGLTPARDGSIAEVVRLFIDFACDYGAGDPVRWSPIAIEILLGDWLPRKAVLEPGQAKLLPEVLRRFVGFSAGRKGLADSVIAETLEAVDRFAPEFMDGMSDGRRAGPAKEIAMALRTAGIDLADESSVQRWIDERNEALESSRDRSD